MRHDLSQITARNQQAPSQAHGCHRVTESGRSLARVSDGIMTQQLPTVVESAQLLY